MASADKPPQAADALPGPIVFHDATAVEPPWISAAAVALGEGAIRQYLLVEIGGLPRLRLELRASHRAEHWSRTLAIVWKEQIVVGFAQRVCFIAPSGTVTDCVELEACFDAFRPEADRLLVASGQDITCFDSRGSILWRSECLGIDGVVIHSVDDDLICGDGEWDPPGGWQPFVISLSDGRRRDAP